MFVHFFQLLAGLLLEMMEYLEPLCCKIVETTTKTTQKLLKMDISHGKIERDTVAVSVVK